MNNSKLMVEFIVNTVPNKKVSVTSLTGYTTGISVYGTSAYIGLDNKITAVSFPDSGSNNGNVRVRLTTSLTNNLGDLKPAFVYINSSNCVLNISSYT